MEFAPALPSPGSPFESGEKERFSAIGCTYLFRKLLDKFNNIGAHRDSRTHVEEHKVLGIAIEAHVHQGQAASCHWTMGRLEVRLQGLNRPFVKEAFCAEGNKRQGDHLPEQTVTETQ